MACNDPVLYLVKGQEPGLGSQIRAQYQFSNLCQSNNKVLPPCQILVIDPAFCFLLIFCLETPRTAQVQQTIKHNHLLQPCR
jgi:hypothetical protein